jgi:hypothetical protein
VVITSGTLSPIDLYPRILNFNPVAIQSFAMTLTRCCACPSAHPQPNDDWQCYPPAILGGAGHAHQTCVVTHERSACHQGLHVPCRADAGL